MKSNADQYTPEVSTPTVDQNAAVDPNSVVTNQAKLPQGTKYSWTTTPDTSKAGQTATGSLHVAYPDGSSEDVTVKVNVKSNADQYTPTPVTTPVKTNENTTLTDDQAKAAIDNNADLPADTTYTWSKQPDTKKYGDTTGEVTVRYPDGTSETVTVPVHVNSDAENYPIQAGNPVEVDDPAKLTDDEKGEVIKAVEDANKDDNGNSTLPDGTKITVDDNGDVTVTYPDGSEDTIPGDKVVEGKDNGGETGDQTDAEKNNPAVPGDKVKVDDPAKLTDDEKKDVVKAVEDANKDDNGNSTLPDGTQIAVGDNGDVTVTYPDGSEDTIPGDKVVEGKTDADKTDVTVPGTKVEVGDPTKLTDGEKGQVEEAIKDANPNLPDGTKITVADDGTATILYPDGSYKVIDGQDLVTKPGQTTADQVTPVVPGDKVTVVDPNHLTDAEKDQVKTNVEKANQNNFPAGTVVMVADDGTATITYPDGSVDQISAADLITKPTAAGQAGKGTGTTTTNGQGAPAGQGKADQAKTLPQTGNEQGSLLAASGLGMLLLGLLGLLGLGGKRKKED